MSGRAAVAAALLKAGNLDGAEREARALLERDPHDSGALDLLTTVALHRGDHATALAVTEDWVAREPRSPLARRNRVLALTRAKKKRQTREALERYKADFPLDKGGYEGMSMAMATAFGESEAAIERIGALRRQHGDELPLDQFEAVAKSQAGQMFGAARAADRILEKNPEDTTALLIKAVNAYRLCRFWKARRLARQLRELAPEKAAAANEIIYASYAACFPPFLLTQLCLILLFLDSSIRMRKSATFLFAMVVVMLPIPFIMFMDFLAERTGIPHFQDIFYWSMAGWGIYSLVVFQRFSGRRRSAKSVRLSENY